MKKQRMNSSYLMSRFLAGLMVCSTFFGTSFTAMAKETVAVQLEQSEHGGLSFEQTDDTELSVTSGSILTVEPHAEDGYEVDYISTVDDTGNVTDIALLDGKATFRADESLTVIASFSEANSNEVSVEPVHEEAFAILETEKASKQELETSKAYILSHIDTTYTGNGDSLAIADAMNVTTTVVDGSVLADKTLNGLWKDDDGDGLSDHADAMVNQTFVYIPLYSVSNDGDYLVGRVAGELDNAEITDYATVKNNAEAEILSDIIFDEASRLVYVPKSYTVIDKKNDSAQVMQTRMQLVVSADKLDEAGVSFPIRVNHEGVDGKLANTGRSNASLLAVSTDIQIAKNEEALEDIKASTFDSVEINGISYLDGEGVWVYDEASGILTIGIAPMAITDVKINLSESFGKTLNRMWDGVTNFFSPEVKAAKPSGETILPGEMKFPSAVTNHVGSSYYASGSYRYHSNGTSGYANPMCSVSDYNAGFFEEKIAQQALGVLDVSLDLATTTTSIERSANIPAQTINGVEIPAMTVNLVCSHANISINGDTGAGVNGTTNWGDGYINVRVIAVSGDYVIIGIVVPTVNTQAGGGFFKVRWGLTGGKARLQKYSANPEYTDGNSAYNLTGAKYGVFRDKACTTRVATLTVQNNTGLTDLTPLLEAGTYWIKEEAGTALGYAINPKVTSFTIQAGVMDTVVPLTGEMKEPTLDDPIGILVEKSFKDWNKE